MLKVISTCFVSYCDICLVTRVMSYWSVSGPCLCILTTHELSEMEPRDDKAVVNVEMVSPRNSNKI
jgi:hypothetical protein